MTEGELPKYRALSSRSTLGMLNDLIEEIKSGKFKVVESGMHGENEVLILPNPGGKPHTKATGKTVKTYTIKVCNQVEE